jgi:hypothetical protein
MSARKQVEQGNLKNLPTNCAFHLPLNDMENNRAVLDKLKRTIDSDDSDNEQPNLRKDQQTENFLRKRKSR